jgi:hypothetical protein
MLLRCLAERDGDDDARLVADVLSIAGRDVEADADALHAVQGRVWPRFEQMVRTNKDMALPGQLLALRVFLKTAPPRLWVVWNRRATCMSALELPFCCDAGFDALVESLAAGIVPPAGSELAIAFGLLYFLPLVVWAESLASESREETGTLSPRIAAIAKACFHFLWPIHRSMRLLTEEYRRTVEDAFADKMTKSFDEDPRREVSQFSRK